MLPVFLGLMALCGLSLIKRATTFRRGFVEAPPVGIVAFLEMRLAATMIFAARVMLSPWLIAASSGRCRFAHRYFPKPSVNIRETSDV
jgi:hypothetical protein